MPCLGKTFSVDHTAPFSQAVRLPLWDWTGRLSDGLISGSGLVMCRTVKPKQKAIFRVAVEYRHKSLTFSHGVSDVFTSLIDLFLLK